MPDTTIAEDTIAALVTALEGITVDEETANVVRNRATTVTDFPTLNIHDGGEEAGQEFVGMERLTLTPEVEIYVKATQAAAGTDLKRLAGRVRALVLADRTFGGLAQDTRVLALQDVEPDESEAHGDHAMAGVVPIEIEIWVAEGDPFTQAS